MIQRARPVKAQMMTERALHALMDATLLLITTNILSISA